MRPEVETSMELFLSVCRLAFYILSDLKKKTKGLKKKKQRDVWPTRYIFSFDKI